MVHYALVLEGDTAGITNDTMTSITLRSNQVEKSYTDLDEMPTAVYTITDFRNYITAALRKETPRNNGNATLEMDPDSLQLENGKRLFQILSYRWCSISELIFLLLYFFFFILKINKEPMTLMFHCIRTPACVYMCKVY